MFTKPTLSRRAFLAAAASAVPWSALRSARADTGRKLALGHIGTGRFGTALLAASPHDAVAICDVDADHRNAAAVHAAPGLRLYSDYRELLKQNGLDGVVIATPDHWHVVQAIHACEAGLPVLLAAPAVHRLGEIQPLLDAAARGGVPVHVVHPAAAAWQALALDPLTATQATMHAAPNPGGGNPAAAGAPPATLDWNAWLGPAPYRPYNPDYAHASFRWMRDLGGGRLAEEGVHAFAALLAAWQIDTPLTVRATAQGSPQASGLWDCPATLLAQLELPAAGRSFTWEQRIGQASCDVSFGEEAARTTIQSVDTDPVWRCEGAGCPETSPAVTPGQAMRDWTDAILARDYRPDNLLLGCRAAAMVQVALLAHHLGRTLTWQEATGRFEEDPQANRMLLNPGWSAWISV
jgi:predicted dehydrogenase